MDMVMTDPTPAALAAAREWLRKNAFREELRSRGSAQLWDEEDVKSLAILLDRHLAPAPEARAGQAFEEWAAGRDTEVLRHEWVDGDYDNAVLYDDEGLVWKYAPFDLPDAGDTRKAVEPLCAEILRLSNLALEAEAAYAAGARSLGDSQASGWVRCEERLPEPGIRVQCFNTAGNVFTAHNSREGGEWWTRCSTCECEDKTVTHWQPLPEPPGD